ncbi:hypothetical protein K4K48_009854 [Colletotrichum sp. SAR 10_66]|nr:hypothetical protein K4K51_001182 [Colletotrichum sp. SAR 10_75]KAI8198932.1 hypothetical protein K4K52_009308 [Colletotrichum sp. SAR 10_76]KAJ4995714.1 hypothetical protein K4K48_009854 [Colletotrichum sp. SAR 10_66]
MMAAYQSLSFGFELELSFNSSKKHKTWLTMAQDTSARLTKKGVNNQVKEKVDPNYRKWSIVQEITIPQHPSKNNWALELVSPIFSLDSLWLADTGNIFSAIQKHSSIQDIPQCSTHVHISQDGQDFSPYQLAALSKAILTYEACFDALVPADRESAYWCQSNRWNPIMARCQTMEDCWDILDTASQRGTSAVVEAMCIFPASSAYGRAHGRKKDFVHGKVYKWNFARLLGNENGRTIEFRQPSGSTCAEDAIGWVLLTLTFVAGATAGGGGSVPTTLVSGWYWIRAVASPNYHSYLQAKPTGTPSKAYLDSPSTAGQFKIEDGQLVHLTGSSSLYLNVENPADKTQRKLETWFATTKNTYGTFAFQGDTLTWSTPDINRPNLAAWLVCENQEVFINTGAYLYQTPAGCYDQTIHSYGGSTADL